MSLIEQDGGPEHHGDGWDEVCPDNPSRQTTPRYLGSKTLSWFYSARWVGNSFPTLDQKWVYLMHLSKSLPNQAPRKTSKKTPWALRKHYFSVCCLFCGWRQKKNSKQSSQKKPIWLIAHQGKKSFSTPWGNRAEIPKAEYFIIAFVLMQSCKCHKHGRFSADKLDLPNKPAKRKMKER